GSFTFTPSANYNGPDSFTFQASDGSLSSNIATVSITVTPVNDAPVANNGSATTAEDTPVSGQSSDTRGEGDALTFRWDAGHADGSVALCAGGNFTYTPAANYNGPDSFTFRASDGSLSSNTATVSLTVTPVNDAPVANNGSATTAEDTPLSGQ